MSKEARQTTTPKSAAKPKKEPKPPSERKKPEHYSLEEQERIFEEHGGKCALLGTQMKPLSRWHIVGGKLLSPEGKRLLKGRTIEEARAGLTGDLEKAEAAVASARKKLENAERRRDALLGRAASAAATAAPETVAQ